jgi:hypothetical protein
VSLGRREKGISRREDEEERDEEKCGAERETERARVCVLPAKINRWWDYVYAYTSQQ